MEKIRFDIVGLYHWDLRDHWKEYAAEAVGKQLTMQPEPENVKDPYAVRAREGGLHVGYVAVTDLDMVYQAMKGSGLKRLRGMVVESNAEPPVLTVECEVESIDWNYEPFDDSVYAGWKYDGLPLMPKKMETLGDLTIDLEDALTARESPELILRLAKPWLTANLFDASREMTRARYHIERLLTERQETELQQLATQLRLQKGMVMRHVHRDKFARYLFLKVPKELKQKGLEQSHYTFDNRLDELEQQLHAFPYHLYDVFLHDPVDFLREVYYKHVPRRYLLQLLSGIVLMIMKGRIKIEQWGRDGDTEPIETIEHFTSSLSLSDRDETLKQSLKELMEKKDAQGKHIINQKNQWAGIMSVLVFEYHVIDAPDMRAFCRKMDEWGYGPDNGYDCFCDYDSLSKCSKYAMHPFTNWKGKGTAHQRQVRAATELRGILKAK